MQPPKSVGAKKILKIPEPKPYHGSDAQKDVRKLLEEGPQRYTCLAGGTRSGKTFLIVRAILARAARAPGSRHAILRFHANAARATIARDTLPKVARLCFPGVKVEPKRGDSIFTLTACRGADQICLLRRSAAERAHPARGLSDRRDAH